MPAKEGAKRRKKETFTISFRVDADHLGQLEKGATPYGVSVHEYARIKLLESLDCQEENRILEETEAIRRTLEGLQNGVAATLGAVLINVTEATGQEDQDRIRGWVRDCFRAEGDGGGGG